MAEGTSMKPVCPATNRPVREPLNRSPESCINKQQSKRVSHPPTGAQKGI